MMCVKSLSEHYNSLERQRKRAVQQNIATSGNIEEVMLIDSLLNDIAQETEDHIARVREARKESTERDEALQRHGGLIRDWSMRRATKLDREAEGRDDIASATRTSGGQVNWVTRDVHPMLSPKPWLWRKLLHPTGTGTMTSLTWMPTMASQMGRVMDVFREVLVECTSANKVAHQHGLLPIPQLVLHVTRLVHLPVSSSQEQARPLGRAFSSLESIGEIVVLSIQHQHDVDERLVNLEAQCLQFEQAQQVREDGLFNRTQSVVEHRLTLDELRFDLQKAESEMRVAGKREKRQRRARRGRRCLRSCLP